MQEKLRQGEEFQDEASFKNVCYLGFEACRTKDHEKKKFHNGLFKVSLNYFSALTEFIAEEVKSFS